MNDSSKRRNRIWLFAAVGVLIQATGASAQQVTVPDTLNPAFLQRNLEQPSEIKPQSKIELPRTEGATAPDNADAVTFVYNGIDIEGATAIPITELMRTWPHEPGETANVAEIFRFARDITDLYRKAGYTLSFALVPAQSIENGRFSIHVVEGFVERVVVNGTDRKRVRARIKQIARSITKSRPLRAVDMERALLLINDLPGLEVSGVLSPAERQGGAQLTLKAQYKPVAGSVGYNNYMPDTLGEHVMDAAAEVRGVVNGSDHLRLRVQRSLGSDAYRSVSGDISTAVGADGLRIGVSGFYSKSDPEDRLLDILDYYGTSAYGRVYVEYPIIRSRDRNLYVGGSFEINNTTSDLLAQTFFDDKLRPLSAWVAYDYLDSTRASTKIKATVNQGLPVFSAQGNSRADGQLDYTTLQLDLRRDQPVSPLAEGALSVKFAGFGQVAVGGGGLFSAAECSFGGRRFGRAFDAGIIAGDHCVMGSAALHWTTGVDLPQVPVPAALDLYAFLDGGIAWQANTSLGEDGRSAATSGGLGMRMQIGESASGLLEVSRPLSLSGGEVDSTPRVVGGITFRF